MIVSIGGGFIGTLFASARLPGVRVAGSLRVLIALT
jgi:hypothetical protein